jgi:hypothetical protein
MAALQSGHILLRNEQMFGQRYQAAKSALLHFPRPATLTRLQLVKLNAPHQPQSRAIRWLFCRRKTPLPGAVAWFYEDIHRYFYETRMPRALYDSVSVVKRSQKIIVMATRWLATMSGSK